ncbi:hypothetical protein ACIGO8_17335 [Streptomyces sp. NPDC053493]|uniref:hypothetical protein n=1 Tax=Streptomyces sp. NPDC053493 TaxID=3365705 RepID=UPI0037CE11D4
MGNHLAQHRTLSAVAMGLALHIQSLPDGADVSVKRLTLRFREGEITIRRALNELVAAGYLERRRVSLGGGRFATRLIFYDMPGCGSGVPTPPPRPEPDTEPDPEPDPEPEPRPARTPEPAAVPAAAPSPPPPPPPARPSGPAADLLARLRVVDSRLLLSWRDVRELAPAVDAWLALDASPEQIARTLTGALPPDHVPIHHPARFLAYRLRVMIPPPLPAATRPPRVLPVVSCEGCERGMRSEDPTPLCADCRQAATA